MSNTSGEKVKINLEKVKAAMDCSTIRGKLPEKFKYRAREMGEAFLNDYLDADGRPDIESAAELEDYMRVDMLE